MLHGGWGSEGGGGGGGRQRIGKGQAAFLPLPKLDVRNRMKGEEEGTQDGQSDLDPFIKF